MKGGLICFIKGIEYYILKNINIKNICIICTGDEEKYSYGIKFMKEIFIKKKVNINNCIVGEPSSKNILGDRIRTGRRGSLNLKIIFKGKQMHTAYLQNNKNAILKTIRYVNKYLYIKKKPNTKIIITNIYTKNKTYNIISNNVIVNINIRYLYKENIKSIINKINSVYKIAKTKIIQNSKPYFCKFNRYINKYIKINNFGGTSEGRIIFKFCRNIIELGHINKYIHNINERINVKDIFILKNIYFNILSNNIYI